MAITSEFDCSKKYGIPIYGAAWVPPAAMRSVAKSTDAGAPDGDEKSSPPITSSDYIILAGGGGQGRSGIPNDLLICQFDFDSNTLSDQPVTRLGNGADLLPDLPYRMSVHPEGEGLICSLPNSCRWFEWNAAEGTENQALSLKSSKKALTPLEDVSQQLALSFSKDGSLLAAGGEDGKLKVFKWPSMELILEKANAHASVKDLDFSADGKLLVSVGSGPARIWDVNKSATVASLENGSGEVFGFCRFSGTSDADQVLYVTAMGGQGGTVVKWNTSSWKRISSRRIVRDPISAFNVSADGKLLALGTIEGGVYICSSTSMAVLSHIKKAHLGLVTALSFSADSRALLSASMDSSSRVTLVKNKKENGLNLWIILLIVALAVALYYAKKENLIGEWFHL